VSGQMETFTLWQCTDGSITFVAGGNPPQFADGTLEDPEAALLWRCEAVSRNDACRQLHEHMGWEPYRPMEGQS
jgi:hypothetical protein